MRDDFFFFFYHSWTRNHQFIHFSIILFLNKMVTPRSKFSFAFSCFNHLDVICNCCYFGIIFIYRHHNVAFIHIKTIQTNKIY